MDLHARRPAVLGTQPWRTVPYCPGVLPGGGEDLWLTHSPIDLSRDPSHGMLQEYRIPAQDDVKRRGRFLSILINFLRVLSDFVVY